MIMVLFETATVSRLAEQSGLMLEGNLAMKLRVLLAFCTNLHKYPWPDLLLYLSSHHCKTLGLGLVRPRVLFNEGKFAHYAQLANQHFDHCKKRSFHLLCSWSGLL